MLVAVMIDRDVEPRLKTLARQFPAIVLKGPPRSGESTVCQKVFAHLPCPMLESPDVRAFASEDPRGFRTIPASHKQSAGFIIYTLPFGL